MGLIIFLTGLMHIFGGFRTGPMETHLFSRTRKWSWTAFLLGLFEMVLGTMLVIEPLGRGPLVYFAATVWALVGGVILIGDAVRLRRLRRLREQASPVDEVAANDG
jgi:uncharacterized membrane protein HdeD (DUF308 family)